MGTTIKMNGREMQVSNSFSSGPGTATREYELRSEWAPGQFTYTRVRRTPTPAQQHVTDLEVMADEQERRCCECLQPAAFGSATCPDPVCIASLKAWLDCVTEEDSRC